MYILIEVGVVHSTIHTKNTRILAYVKTVCRAKPSGYMFSPKFKSGRWNGFISLMKSSNTFPTGLLSYVVSGLREKEHKVCIQWGDVKPFGGAYKINPNCLVGITLRDYQIEAASILLSAGRGIAKMATNSGKTEVMAAMINILDTNALVLVHRKELMYQTAERISMRTGRPVGIIGDGQCDVQNVTVGMIQTLANTSLESLKHNFECLDVIFIDECHHGSSAQYLNVLESLPGMMRFGFSGTPLKMQELDDMRLISMTGRVLYDLPNSVLIDAGYSAKPFVHMIDIVSDDDDDWKLPYQDAYKELIVHNEARNGRIAMIAMSAASFDGKVVLIIVRHIAHGKLLQELIPGSIYVHGSKSSDYRQQVLIDMRMEPGVYIATTILDEGVDVPSIEVLIMAAGGKSERMVLQRVGRGLRKKDGVNELHVYDFIDDTNKHLLNHSEERLDVYIHEGFDVVAVGNALS